MRVRTVVGALGLAGSLLALGLVLAPTAFLSIRPIELATSALPTDNPRALLLGLGVVLGLGAIVFTHTAAGSGHGQAGPLVERPPEAVHAESSSPPGSKFDRSIGKGDVRETLAETTVETLVRQAGTDRADARAAVEAGTWTDDPVAAAFLGAPTQPLSARIRHWLDPAAERQRRVDRTVRAIERLEGST